MKNIISYIIVIGLIAISLFSTKRYGLLGFVLLLCLIGSDTDSAGILYAITGYVPGYKLIIRGITLVLFVYSVVVIFKLYSAGKLSSKVLKFYVLPLLFSALIIFFNNIFRGVDIITSLSEIIWLGIPIFFIWTTGSYRTKQSSIVFIKIIKYQAIVTILILLLGPLVTRINGVSYAYLIGEDYWRTLSDTVINSKISLGGFDKQSLSTMKFAQYHNPNALGVYSCVFIATSFFLFMFEKHKLNKLILSFFLLIVGVIGWFNSLTKGPIFLVVLILFVYLIGILIRPKTYKRVFLLLFVGILAVININSIVKVMGYILVDSSSISVVSRLDGFTYAFNAIMTNPLGGVVHQLTDPIPHILPLKIAAYYGLPAAILITIPFLHLIITTIKVFLKDLLAGESEKSLYPSMLVGIIFGTYLTNGVVVYVLFWVLFSEAMKGLGLLDSEGSK